MHFNLIYNTKEELHGINKIELFVSNNWGQNLGDIRANWMKIRCKKIISEVAERKPLSWTAFGFFLTKFELINFWALLLDETALNKVFFLQFLKTPAFKVEAALQQGHCRCLVRFHPSFQWIEESENISSKCLALAFSFIVSLLNTLN